ncbi:MAG: TrmH family RNA methyltransferase [Patescibacteria group bacterium]|nr:TrmH family RNA methyltransferase [Patescibacteria group bacterium]MDE1940496.1 TrmH family RNA methyltransferase [Patescibacteria group bacterium]MDE1966562.1 TrmH family RNA methyltransferase [Patescibacteria group bacterium]
MRKASRDIRLLLDDIRSVHNAGSIFRTAECAGVSMIYCFGTTPMPLDRFGQKRKDFAKVSLGAEDLVGWEHVADWKPLIKRLKKEGFKIIAVEQSTKSVDHRRLRSDSKMLLILGNEVDGVSKPLLDSSDLIAEIPIHGKKESLNVSVAAGVALFSIQ